MIPVILRWGLVSRNVAALTDPPLVEAHEGRALTVAEAKAFIAALVVSSGPPIAAHLGHMRRNRIFYRTIALLAYLVRRS